MSSPQAWEQQARDALGPPPLPDRYDPEGLASDLGIPLELVRRQDEMLTNLYAKVRAAGYDPLEGTIDVRIDWPVGPSDTIRCVAEWRPRTTPISVTWPAREEQP